MINPAPLQDNVIIDKQNRFTQTWVLWFQKLVKFLTNPVDITIKGVTDASDAATGVVGEYVSSNIASGSAIGLTSAATANITSISLTAGDWDVIGHVYYTGGATTNVQRARQSISTTSATMNQTNGNFTQIAPQATIFAAGDITAVPPCAQRISLNATTTIYLVAQAIFTVSTCSAYGFIQARRAR